MIKPVKAWASYTKHTSAIEIWPSSGTYHITPDKRYNPSIPVIIAPADGYRVEKIGEWVQDTFKTRGIESSSEQA